MPLTATCRRRPSKPRQMICGPFSRVHGRISTRTVRRRPKTSSMPAVWAIADSPSARCCAWCGIWTVCGGWPLTRRGPSNATMGCRWTCRDARSGSRWIVCAMPAPNDLPSRCPPGHAWRWPYHERWANCPAVRPSATLPRKPYGEPFRCPTRERRSSDSCVPPI